MIWIKKAFNQIRKCEETINKNEPFSDGTCETSGYKRNIYRGCMLEKQNLFVCNNWIET